MTQTTREVTTQKETWGVWIALSNKTRTKQKRLKLGIRSQENPARLNEEEEEDEEQIISRQNDKKGKIQNKKMDNNDNKQQTANNKQLKNNNSHNNNNNSNKNNNNHNSQENRKTGRPKGRTKLRTQRVSNAALAKTALVLSSKNRKKYSRWGAASNNKSKKPWVLCRRAGIDAALVRVEFVLRGCAHHWK